MNCFRTALATTVVALICCCVSSAFAGELSIRGEEILLDGEPVKVIGLRCSNSLMSDATTDQLIEQLDDMQSYGLNTVSVFVMGSRFGDIAGYRPDGSLDPAVKSRLARVLDATDERGMICIVGCLYWSTSRAKEKLDHWTEADAAKAIAGTAKWIAERGDRHVIMDVDNEGMAARAKKWSTTKLDGRREIRCSRVACRREQQRSGRRRGLEYPPLTVRAGQTMVRQRSKSSHARRLLGQVQQGDASEGCRLRELFTNRSLHGRDEGRSIATNPRGTARLCRATSSRARGCNVLRTKASAVRSCSSAAAPNLVPPPTRTPHGTRTSTHFTLTPAISGGSKACSRSSMS